MTYSQRSTTRKPGVPDALNLQGRTLHHPTSTTPHTISKIIKKKDASRSIAFYSKYDPDWQSKVNTGSLNTLSFGDDYLSKQQCCPVSIQAHEQTLYDLTDTYWVGGNNVPADQQYLFPCPALNFLYKIGEGHDDDHKQHGGYSLYIWVNLPAPGNHKMKCTSTVARIRTHQTASMK